MSHCCGHDHSEETSRGSGDEHDLLLKIDWENIQCLNESVDLSGRSVFKKWDERLNTSDFVESDDDPELLFNIPFCGAVKLKGLILIGEDGGKHPSEIKIYKNIEGATFHALTSIVADQSISLQQDIVGSIEYPLKVSKFNSVSCLSILVTNNFGADVSKVFYIGLRGDFMHETRQKIVLTSYEAQANPADHKTDSVTPVNQQPGF